ncbi:MAG: 1-(5-phosphoribosyl)-5-[(5-phosphoribosylamino)methylideneamino]imidazole-4-carboxamide isomerase [Candidatus Omnitrophica bacterium]|nr:1-(5-phosphoribosyl)-5-[(5-phosphoribosylamino)methylideneamino]imidazole-4-carboxamide isomerase [Candidatus Omnitrophota bacterium]
MLIIPAIDLKDGCVVRLTQGKFDKSKRVYSKNPLKTAKHWVSQGAKFIHIVDLDGASSGVPGNLALAQEIARDTGIPVQFGGGVRDIGAIKKILECGISRVVLGTQAIEDDSFLKKAFKNFKHKVIVSLDAKEGRLLVKGWKDRSRQKKDALGFAFHLKQIGFRDFIYTDILKDGTLMGPNIKDIRRLLKETGMRLIASGGISSLADIRKLSLFKKEGLSGVIVGKALYEGKFTLAQAIKIA